MAAMIGKGKSWLWWLAGFVCALVLGPRAGAVEAPAPVYGMPVPPPDDRPPADADAQKKADELVSGFLAPVPAPAPPAAAKAEIDKLIADFGSDDPKVREAASAAVVKQGVAALGQLREALASKDAEVADRARTAIGAIEAAVRAPQVEELKKLGTAGQTALRGKWTEANRAALTAEKAAEDADKAGKPEEAEKLRAEAKVQRERAATLSTLLRQVGPQVPVMKYGVVPRLQVE